MDQIVCSAALSSWVASCIQENRESNHHMFLPKHANQNERNEAPGSSGTHAKLIRLSPFRRIHAPPPSDNHCENDLRGSIHSHFSKSCVYAHVRIVNNNRLIDAKRLGHLLHIPRMTNNPIGS